MSAHPELPTQPLIAVVSPKGGNGKTTISSNLAISLARRTPAIIVDLDVHFGDVEYALRMRPVHRLDDVVNDESLSGERLAGMLSPHPSGLDVLCAPNDPVAADRLDPVAAFAAVDRLTELGRPIVLDTAGGISDYSLGALDRATHIVLVCGTDVPSIQAGRKLLETMRTLHMPLDRVRLVVNRSTAQTGLSVADVEEVLGLSASLLVPEHQSLAAGMNAGTPVTESSPRSAIADTFNEFADDILGIEPGPRRRFLTLRQGDRG
jgi:pilus assembly protein CpaE